MADISIWQDKVRQVARVRQLHRLWVAEVPIRPSAVKDQSLTLRVLLHCKQPVDLLRPLVGKSSHPSLAQLLDHLHIFSWCAAP